MDTTQNYWESALAKYSAKDWVDKPSIFVQLAIEFFPKHGKVLELAAGQGQDSRFLARQDFKVICTDRSDFGLQIARDKADAEGLDMAFQKVDLSEPLPYEDNAFDVVYSHLGLHYFTKEHTRQLFAEIHRILKPQGVMAALFNSADDPEIRGEGFERIKDNYYLEIKTGLQKRYFTKEDAEYFIEGMFEPIILDNEGRAYKDGKTSLIRLIAKAIKDT